jgi:Holliday junction resolvase RusA-like endonuclease
MKTIKLILTGRPITKKNSQRIVNPGKHRPFLIQSKQYLDYEKSCLWQITGQYYGDTITDNISLKALYWMPTKAFPDLANLLGATCDILEKAKVISNDKNIISFDGSRIMGKDKDNPRVEIELIEALKIQSN